VGRSDRQRVTAKEGEFGMFFSLFVKNADGTAYTSFAGTETITMFIQQDGGDVEEVGTGSVYSTATGEVRVVIGSGDVADMPAGLYLGEIEASTAGATLITQDFELLVSRRIGT
jgi:hypothetical protein